jgi:hypothetical protein
LLSYIYEYEKCNCPGKFFSLLPISILKKFRKKLTDICLPEHLEKTAWRIFLIFFRIYLKKGSTLPKTMEISCEDNSHEKSIADFEQCKERVLLVGSMLSYSSTLINIGTSLNEKGLNSCFFVPSNIYQDIKIKLCSTGVSLFALEEFFTDDLEKLYKVKANEICRNWETTKKAILENGSQLLRDIHFVAPKQVRYVSGSVIPQMEVYSRLAGKILDAINPPALFITRLRRLTETVFAAEAKKRGIPVVLANHGHIGNDWLPETLGPVDKICSAVLVWNNDQKKQWKNLFPSLTEEQMHVFGGIQWDKPIQKYIQQKPLKREIRVNLMKSFCCSFAKSFEEERWITITIDDYIRPDFSFLLMQLNNIANVRIFIKTRPHESKKIYQEFEPAISSESTHLVSKEINIDLFDLLYASDIMITSLSTTNLDALAVGIPVVTIVAKKNIYNDKRRLKLETWGLPVIKEKKKIYQTVASFFEDINTRILWKRAASSAGNNLIANYPLAGAGENIDKLIRVLNKKYESQKI